MKLLNCLMFSAKAARPASQRPSAAFYGKIRHSCYASTRRSAAATSSRKKKGTKRRLLNAEKPPKKPSSMAEVKSDETLLFTSVPPERRDALRVVYGYPNEYTVGITSLGYQLVWAFFETHPQVHVSRLFTDISDAINMPSTDLLGFSFSWELDYSNLLDILERLGIPILAKDRTNDHPLVFGGGATLSANPEPYAAFFDIVLVGDGEDLLKSFVERALIVKELPREEQLLQFAQLDGVYIPSLYRPRYRGDSLQGEFVGLDVLNPAAPTVIRKQTYRGEHLASSKVVSPRMAWEDIFMVEVVRSCPEMCRFCLASYLTLPFRVAPVESSLMPTIERGMSITNRIGLLGASVTQHPEFPEIIRWLLSPERSHIRLSIASVRTNTVTTELAHALAKSGTKSLTVAIESGSERVRNIVNKKLDQEDIVRAAVAAQEGGLQAMKLYGMVGVPGEDDDDIEATVEMMHSLKKAAPRMRFTLGCSTFVPKAHTPFQWFGVRPAAEKRLKRLEKVLTKGGIAFRPESYKWSVVQALLSRGDRRVSELLLAARGRGDSLSAFKQAAREIADRLPPLEQYWEADYPPGERALPWSHIQGPLPESTLLKHFLESQKYAQPEI